MNEIICDLYGRVSTAEQAREGYSIGEQEERLRKYAEAMGWIVNEVYMDGGFSGGTLLRPGIQKVIEDAKARKINKLVVYKIDRLSRSQKDTLFLIEDVFLANKVDFVSMTESLDTSTPYGMAMVGILSAFAQLERETIKERMMIGRDALVKSGKYHGNAHNVIGYTYKDKKLEIDPYDSIIVRNIFEEYVSGETLSSITSKLAMVNWRNSKSWQTAKIRRILTQPLYIGRQKWKGETYEVIDCPRFLPEDLWYAAQKEMARRNSPAPKKQSPHSHTTLLGGMLWCGECGNRYCGCSDHDAQGRLLYRYYCYTRIWRNHKRTQNTCNNRSWKATELNEYIIQEIKKLQLKRAAGDLSGVSVAERYADERKSIEKRLSDLSRQQDRLIALFAVGSLDIDAITAKSESIQTERATLLERLGSIERPTWILTQSELDRSLEEFSRLLDQASGDGFYMELYEVVHRLIQSVTVAGDNIRIVWNFEI